MKLQNVQMHVHLLVGRKSQLQGSTLLQRMTKLALLPMAAIGSRDALRLSDRIPGALWLAKIDIYRRGWVGFPSSSASETQQAYC